MYGFHKIPHLQQGVLKSDTETEFWNFEHPHFHRGQPDLLCLVTRKNSKGGSQQTAELVDGSEVPIPGQGTQILDVNSIVTGITAIKRHQQAISADLNELKASNQHLWQEALTARERYKSQQDTINRILKFLASVFGRATDRDGKDVDGHRSPTPLVRRNQLLIGNGPENTKHKGVEVVEVEDDDNKSVAESTRTDDQTDPPRKWHLASRFIRAHMYPVSFAHIDAASVKSPTPALGSPSLAASPGPFFPERSSGLLVPPSPWADTSGPNLPAPSPVSATANNTNNTNSALELHRTASPTQDQIMQAAFQQLMQSPGQVQRLMQLLSSSAPNPSTPPLTSPTVAQPGTTWTPPMAVDLPPLSQLALYDGNAGALTFDDKDTDSGGPRPSQLAEEEARLAHTYSDASDIDADVNALQANINALIENMGLDAATHPHAEQTPSAPVADFDFDAFLTAFASDQDGATVSLPLPEEQQPAIPVAGKKRTSDVAELGLPLPPAALTSPSRGGATVDLDAMSAGPPRAKRNKK